MLLAMLKIEHLKLYRRKALWIELALVAGLIVLMLGGVYLVHATNIAPAPEQMMTTEMLSWPNSFKLSLSVASYQMLGSLLAIVLVSIVVAQEYSWQTYSLPVRAGVPRRTVLAAKFLTLLGAVALLTAVALVVGGLMAAAVSAGVHGSFVLADVDMADVLASTLRTGYTLLPYAAITFFIAVATRSLPATMGLAVGYVFLVEGIAVPLLSIFGGFVTQASQYLPGQLASVLVGQNGGFMAMANAANGSAPVGVDPLLAAALIAVYSLGFVAAAYAIFKRQDLAA